MDSKKLKWTHLTSKLSLSSLIFITPLTTLAMEPDPNAEKQCHTLMVKKWDAEVINHKTRLQNSLGTPHQERHVQELFNAYMQKAVAHAILGEKDNQLLCYKEILNIPALSKVTIARTHTNISVVYLHLDRVLLAAAHLTKAEEFASVADLEKIIGPQTLRVFPTIYYKAFEVLYTNVPEQAILYLQKVLRLPEQKEIPHLSVHLNLAVGYDRLLKFDDSLHHALQVLTHQSLPPKTRDRALCYAAISSNQIDKLEDCIGYFKKINNLKHLVNTERYLVFSAVGNSYLRKGNWEQGFIFGHQALDNLEPHSPHYLFVKHNLATAYGESGNKIKEMELYREVLESMGNRTFEPFWQGDMRLIKMSLETFFFIKEMIKIEKHLREVSHKKTQEEQKSKEEELIRRKQEKNKQKEKTHQKFIEGIKTAQREAVEKEKRLEQERIQRLENEKKRAEERKNRDTVAKENAQNQPGITPFTEPTIQASDKEQAKPKVKTRGIAIPRETNKEEIQSTPQNIEPTLPPLGTRAQAVFDQIEDEDWTFTREEYSYYLEDLQCSRRDSGSAHRIFQLPKTIIISLKRNGQEIQEELFLADENVKLGSVTLPAWKGKQIPFYLRKQLRSLHEKIIMIYTKATKIRATTESKCPF